MRNFGSISGLLALVVSLSSLQSPASAFNFTRRDTNRLANNYRGAQLLIYRTATSCELGVIDSSAVFVAASCLALTSSGQEDNSIDYIIAIDGVGDGGNGRFSVESITLHPEYNPGTLANNIAILKYKKTAPIEWSRGGSNAGGDGSNGYIEGGKGNGGHNNGGGEIDNGEEGGEGDLGPNMPNKGGTSPSNTSGMSRSATIVVATVVPIVTLLIMVGLFFAYKWWKRRQNAISWDPKNERANLDRIRIIDELTAVAPSPAPPNVTPPSYLEHEFESIFNPVGKTQA
ncbi:hypothetical protein GGI10_005191 [Coemansia sp. RSA 2530]|nr:hypothetical protein GGI10_005191 [Coemansia sp. RSA 2530]